MRTSQDDFAVISEDAAKHYKVKIDEANLFIRKMTVSDNVVGAIEETLLKTAAIYRYNEKIPKDSKLQQANKAGNMRIFSLKSQSEESLLNYALV